jgi:hypothetical protein
MLVSLLLTFAFGFLVGLPVGIWLSRSMVMTIRRWHYAAARKLWVRFGDEIEG